MKNSIQFSTSVSLNFVIQLNLFSLTLILFTTCCNKIVDIPPPTNTIVTKQVFSTESNANAAILGIYSKMVSKGATGQFANGALSILCGLSSDELRPFLENDGTLQFYQNRLMTNNSSIYTVLWSSPYSYVYQINSAIESLNNTSEIPKDQKEVILAEAKFLRAFCYFYLTNLFGEVPIIQTSDWENSSLAKRNSVNEVYDFIISDLNEAVLKLPIDYSRSKMERVRANKWAAVALLARVYLYIGNWNKADELSSSVILNNDLFELNEDINNVFLKNSKEAILQWQIVSDIYPYNATPEGAFLVPYDNFSFPFFYISELLLGAFEPGDKRRQDWINTCEFNGIKYFYPYKYKIGQAQSIPNSSVTEYYMVLRLAEQFLIRAEAKAQKGDLPGALIDLNSIRQRAGLTFKNSLSKDSILKFIAQERKVELFAEWGHRWLDLKRTKKINEVMKVAGPYKKSNWNSDMQLYPIPFLETGRDPNLTQNKGYD